MKSPSPYRGCWWSWMPWPHAAGLAGAGERREPSTSTSPRPIYRRDFPAEVLYKASGLEASCECQVDRPVEAVLLLSNLKTFSVQQRCELPRTKCMPGTNLLSLGSLWTSWTHPSLRIGSSSLHATLRDIHVSLANALYYYGVIISSTAFLKDVSNIWLALNAQNHMHASVFFTLICFSRGYEGTLQQMNLDDSWLMMDVLFTFQLTTPRYFLSSCSQKQQRRRTSTTKPPNHESRSLSPLSLGHMSSRGNNITAANTQHPSSLLRRDADG